MSNGDQTAYFVVVIAAISVITSWLIRGFRRKNERPWPSIIVGIYNIVLLFLFLFGMVTQVRSEGFGFVPLLVLTLPWGALAMWLLASVVGLSSHNFAGSGYDPTLVINFVVFNLLAGPANSFILYFVLKRRQKKAAEDEAWEQARRNR